MAAGLTENVQKRFVLFICILPHNISNNLLMWTDSNGHPMIQSHEYSTFVLHINIKQHGVEPLIVYSAFCDPLPTGVSTPHKPVIMLPTPKPCVKICNSFTSFLISLRSLFITLLRTITCHLRIACTPNRIRTGISTLKG